MPEGNEKQGRQADQSASGLEKNTQSGDEIFVYSDKIERRFSEKGQDVYDSVEWVGRDVRMTDFSGDKVIYEGLELEFPSFWSETSCKISASKYFKNGEKYREKSLRQLINRIVDTITQQGVERDYFIDADESDSFRDELKLIMLHQRACFNSPVLFNIGVPGERPQASACFINSVEDSMQSISQLIVTEGNIFKWGSGSGVNYSNIRGEGEVLSTGGTASGPLSFMKVLDANAGAIKSGGKSRRAAKMCVLNIDHPDIERFIDCKVVEERKAHALIDAGYDGSIMGEAYSTISYQNANNSVRVTDEFMKAVEDKGEWTLRAVTDGKVIKKVSSGELMRKIAEAAWITGDPGMQFDTVTNDWHTCPNSGRINGSNPCSEYVFLDDSACNLASINLMKYVENGCFQVEDFAHTVRIMITAQEILCDFAVYPTEAITKNSMDFRPLGLGYTNLGALLMTHGMAYDSDQARTLSAAITSLMHGLANESSALIAERKGAFAGYEANREPMKRVMNKHRAALLALNVDNAPEIMFSEIIRNSFASWDRLCVENRYKSGFRNSQVTLLAPTGTISFFMDAVTTGIEPELSLVKYKNLVEGEVLTLANPLVRKSMEYMGIDDETIIAAEKHVKEHGNLDDFDLPEEQKKVFSTSLGVPGSLTTLSPEAHIRMMAAVQPFLSGAISKTVNMPNDTTVEDIEKMYLLAWKQGLKAVAVYRDGCKRSQPLQVKGRKATAPTEVATVPRRKRLPTTRKAITHKFEIAGHEGYVTAGSYEDGTLGEVFILMHKEGSILSGLLDSVGILSSIALQYGAPLSVIVDKMTHMRFEPSGFTKNPRIPMAKSVVDYIFRWLASEFLPADELEAIGIRGEVKSNKEVIEELSKPISKENQLTLEIREKNGGKSNASYNKYSDAVDCYVCGSLMERHGTCYTCPSCGANTGCS